MGRMSEYAAEQEEQENESGIDMHDCYHHHHPLARVELVKREQVSDHSDDKLGEQDEILK